MNLFHVNTIQSFNAFVTIFFISPLLSIFHYNTFLNYTLDQDKESTTYSNYGRIKNFDLGT